MLTQTIDKGDKIIEIHTDDNPTNPRDPDFQDLDSKMICFHRRYLLGDKHDYKSKDFNSWDEVKRQIEKDNDIAEILPLYLYDHSGITISTKPFSCPWDSGQVGFILITKDSARSAHMVKRLSKKVMAQVHKNLLAEVETYDQYLQNEVYGYVIKDKETEEELDACWGFYGDKYCIEEAESAVSHCKVKPKPEVKDPNQKEFNLA